MYHVTIIHNNIKLRIELIPIDLDIETIYYKKHEGNDIAFHTSKKCILSTKLLFAKGQLTI